jgi:hypothetical protein
LTSFEEVRFLETALPAALIAFPLTRTLFEQVGLRSIVTERLNADTSLEEPVRAMALQFVEKCEESALWLNNRSWEVVREPGRNAADYRLALRQVEAAVRLEPENVGFLNTLGVAQYRHGDYRTALETLSRSNEGNKRWRYEDLAFLAMTHARLNQPEPARKFLEELRQVMKRPDVRKNPEARQFLREAEEVVDGAVPGEVSKVRGR